MFLSLVSEESATSNWFGAGGGKSLRRSNVRRHFLLERIGEGGVWKGGRSRHPHPLSELTEPPKSCLGNMRVRLVSVNIRGQEPLAVEVRSQGSTAKRQIAPAAAVSMRPPIDVGEGLVVEGEAGDKDLGALIITNVLVISTIVKRRITFSLKLGDECRGGALDAYGEGFGKICFEL
ncbi:M42 family peptidase [Babesia caballi]|uniref:M42 family peptidase n=1 Tax=Babesia caballi TaxID=5871 RepID=A0AAV4LRN0_BABCB|nr:M42 family peptidase [Babesia caballi]